MNVILEHNYNHYKNVYAPALRDTILRAVSNSDQLNYRYDVSDKIWYNNINLTVVVPIPGNGMEYFSDIVAEELGYKLVNRIDVPDLHTIPAIAIIRNPLVRFENLLYQSSMTFNSFIDEYNDTDYMKTQASFIDGLSLWEVIDLDYMNTADDISSHDPVIITNIKRAFSHEHNEHDEHDCSSPYQGSITTEQETVVNKLFDIDFKFYNDANPTKEERTYTLVRDNLNEYFNKLTSTRTGIIDCANQMEEQGQWLLESMNVHTWSDHIHIFESIGINNTPKDAAILDMGTQFGIMPHFLKTMGFTDVSCSNSTIEASNGITDLQMAWDKFGLSVTDLHIKDQVEFHLPKKYDIILATRTNILFKTDKILRFSAMDMSYPLQEAFFDSEYKDMFIVPYDEADLKFFINNIKKYLNKGGIAVMQPYPFPYHYEAYDPETDTMNLLFPKELELLSKYQTKHHSPMLSDLSVHDPKLHDYFVIRN
jgi:hypothetical protein